MDFPILVNVAFVSSLAVVAAQQILKLKFIPATFANKYPVPTNILLSIAASIIAVVSNKQATPTGAVGWIALVAFVAVVAGIVYNTLLRNWTELRQMETK